MNVWGYAVTSDLYPPSATPAPRADEVWAYVSLDNVMDSITLHSSSMFIDLAQSLRWNPAKSCRAALLSQDGQTACLRWGGSTYSAEVPNTSPACDFLGGSHTVSKGGTTTGN